jgi:signal transduction histidine kinase
MNPQNINLNIALFVTGVFLVVGSIAPWISLSMLNISGIDGWRGFVAVLSGLMVIVLGSMNIWPHLFEAKIFEKLHLLVLGLLATTTVILFEVAIRINQVAREMNSSSEDASSGINDVDLGELTDAINEFTNSILEAFKPRLAIGWYVTLMASVAAIGMIATSMKRENSSHSPSAEI